MKDRTSITQNINFSDNKMFFTDEMLKNIAHHTNLSSAQQNITKGSIAADKDETER